ncbi:MAG TPA: D-2-hydroxyacid dehydrogenase [Steroidobacteraceae bacterium]|nr:D-2-hydroxyacid dehydrogenase [Steroidobacteraceae bacterium]
MSHSVVFLDRDSLRATVRRPAAAASYVEHAATAPGEVVARLQDATIAITNKVPLREPDLARLPKLRMIAVAATGYDVIDVGYCRAHGIAVANIRNYAVHTVPEHAFALILALRRSLLAYRADVEAGVWQRSTQFCFFTHEIGDLHGSVLGIVGEGALGRGLAQIGAAFGMRAVFADHAAREATDLEFMPLPELLRIADVLSLHCPLTPASRNMIGERELRAMKKSALLINTARGGLVDEAALARALAEGWIGGAGFDVLSSEPPRNGNPLLGIRRPNFILTPHVAWASSGAMQFLADQLIDNIDRWAEGRPQHLVT